MNPFPSDVIAAAQLSHARFYPKGPFASIDLAQWAVEFGIREAHERNQQPVRHSGHQVSDRGS